MIKILKKTTCLLLAAVLLLIFISGCSDTSSREYLIGELPFTSYRDIPGITEDEINAIKALREQYASFGYAMMPYTEAFLNEHGEIGGFSVHVTEWLTKLFDIPFVPYLVTWQELTEGLDNGEIDFSGVLLLTEERRQTYFMTDAIARRTVKHLRLPNSEPLSEIASTRPVRYAFLSGGILSEVVSSLLYGEFEYVIVDEYIDAYELLLSGEIDSVIALCATEAIYDDFGGVVTSDISPLLYFPVAITASREELEPVISVIQKAIKNGATHHLSRLYEQGHQDYLRHKFHLHLTDEEKAYINTNRVIPIAAESDNYPVCFYNTRYEQWQGVSIDVLRQVENLTGLEFVPAHDPHTQWYQLLGMLESGEVYMVTELLQTPVREGLFLWPDSSIIVDRSALITVRDFPNVIIHDVLSLKVGVVKGSAHYEWFRLWFPDHDNTEEYGNFIGAFEGLANGEVDMVMASNNILLHLTHFQEQHGYRANIIFSNHLESTFGINKDQTILHSIINKAFEMIETEVISDQWVRRTYDYHLVLTQTQRAWTIGTAITLGAILVALTITFTIIHVKNSKKREIIAKQSESLAAMNVRIDAIIQNLPGMAYQCMANAPDYTLTFVSNGSVELLGYTPDEMVGGSNKFMAMIHPEDISGVEKQAAETLDHGLVYENNYRIILPNGSVKWVLERAHVTEYESDGTSNMIEGYVFDITERRQLEIAEFANQAKSAFLANMSHEIRTPMNAVLSITEIMIQDETIPDEIMNGLGMIYSSGNLLLGIINDILDFSKLEAGKMEIHPIEYEIASLIYDSIQLNMIRVDENPIEFIVQIDENLPAKMIGDELRIKQILSNLLSNAFKYTEAGVVTLSVSFEEDKSASQDHEGIILIINVQDTGYGMTEEQVDKLFDEYTRFEQDFTRTIEGTGLGLAISKYLTTLMDGEILVNSEYGIGSSFTLRLPQKKVNTDVLGSELVKQLAQFRDLSSLLNKNSIQLIRDPMPYGSVLIVDDVESNLYVARTLMKPYKLEIETVTSGFEAIEKISGGMVYDIIFMDHMMPKMNGMEATRRLRDLGYTKPIVALTANALVGQAEIYLQNGFDAFISKPIDMRQLNSVLNKLVRDMQPKDVIQNARKQMTKKHIEDAKTIEPALKQILNDVISKEITGLDIIKGMNRYNNDVKAYLQILRLYSAGTRSALDKIAIIDEDDLTDYTVIVHGIKGSSLDIYAEAVGEKAAMLEEAGKSGDIGYITDHNPVFLNQARVLISSIDDLILSVDRKIVKPKKDILDYEALKRLVAACETYNLSEVSAIMDEIEAYQYESEGEFVQWLRDLVDVMDYSQIVKKLSDIEP
ncbi:MAG: transporter substrate-binding domain-containing protein [Oscillospiraceae bacterium]|jgi:PAS domain S-box-containing protein|nr:transporter substrate-binding domain-containing protein [Oscillospiraceae bacterium]